MLKASIVVNEFYGNNRLFDLSDPVSNRDNCLHSFWFLREEFRRQGADLQTSDKLPVELADVVLYVDMPKQLPKQLARMKDVQKSFLIAMESLAVIPRNFDRDLYRYFEKVFTWNDECVDARKVFKVNYAFALHRPEGPGFSDRRKFICVIANNKRSSHPNELYTKRAHALRWYEDNHPDKMSLYGGGWDLLWGGQLAGKVLNKFSLRPKTTRYSKIHKGMANVKSPLLREHKFNLCFENIKDVPGYITEKIFDCFFTGCVPVYLGAGNVREHIPFDCFIDYRDFNSHDQLLKFLEAIDEKRFSQYQDEARRFIESESGSKFSSECFAKTIVAEVLASVSSASKNESSQATAPEL